MFGGRVQQSSLYPTDFLVLYGVLEPCYQNVRFSVSFNPKLMVEKTAKLRGLLRDKGIAAKVREQSHISEGDLTPE